LPSVDTVSEDDNAALFKPEFLHTLTPSGLPPHQLQLKVGSPVMLMRNLNPREGACNGTRLMITHISKRLITATIIGGEFHDGWIFIPRVSSLDLLLKSCVMFFSNSNIFL